MFLTSLSHTQLDGTAITLLSGGLQHNTCVLNLRLTGNETMGRLGVVYLARALRFNTCLLNLRLGAYDLPVQELYGTAQSLVLNGAWVPPNTPWTRRKEARQLTHQLTVLDCVFVTEVVKYNQAMTDLRCAVCVHVASQGTPLTGSACVLAVAVAQAGLRTTPAAITSSRLYHSCLSGTPH